MATWNDGPVDKPQPGTTPRSAWSRFFEAVGLVHHVPEPEFTGDGPCCGTSAQQEAELS